MLVTNDSWLFAVLDFHHQVHFCLGGYPLHLAVLCHLTLMLGAGPSLRTTGAVNDPRPHGRPEVRCWSMYS